MSKKLLLSLMILLMCVCPLKAEDPESQDGINLVEEIEEFLQEDDSSVSEALEGFKRHLISERSSMKDLVEKEKYEELIQTVDELLDICYSTKNGDIRDDLETSYALGIAAISAWFSNKGYDLANELLLHSYSNTTLNSIYYPVYGYKVESSSAFWACRNNYSVSSGSGTFGNSSSNTNEMDLYYAIHHFNWYRLSNSYIRISDRYDFAYDKNYWGTIQGYAVAFMYSAQTYGVITPYYVYIERP